jgi:hypothetical protein
VTSLFRGNATFDNTKEKRGRRRMADVINLEGVIERQKVGGFLLLTLAMSTVVQLIEGFDLVAAGVVGPALANSPNIDRA